MERLLSSDESNAISFPSAFHFLFPFFLQLISLYHYICFILISHFLLCPPSQVKTRQYTTRRQLRTILSGVARDGWPHVAAHWEGAAGQLATKPLTSPPTLSCADATHKLPDNPDANCSITIPDVMTKSNCLGAFLFPWGVRISLLGCNVRWTPSSELWCPGPPHSTLRCASFLEGGWQ